VLGKPVVDPFSRTYCGNGVLAACRTALWSALGQAAADLEAEFGSPDVADWKRQIADEDVRHTAAGVTSVPAIHWINRPTFQQVVQIPAIDRFKCYRARGLTPFARRTVALADELESKSTVVVRPESICNPVDADGMGIVDPTAHVACYRIRDAAGQARFARRSVSEADELGARTLDLTRAQSLCVPSTVDGVASELRLDDFKCYRATRPRPPFVRTTVSLADLFESKSATLMRPDTVCTPVDRDGGGILDSASRLTCYRLTERPRFAGQTVAVANDLGNAQTLRAGGAISLCVPSVLD
jgi:hypothetical protein